MKKILDAIKKTPMLLALVVIALGFFPRAIIAPSESATNAIVTAVGLDKVEDNYEVTLLTFLSHPNQSYSEQYEVISSSAPSVSEAFTNASLQIGKTISLFHTHTAIVSEDMLQEDIVNSLDYLARIASLPQSCVLISTNVTSKQFLEFVQELDRESDINLEDLLFYTSNYVFWKFTTINSFYEGYYSPVHSSILGHLTIQQGDVNGIPITKIDNVTGAGGGQSGGSGGGEESGGQSGSSSQATGAMEQTTGKEPSSQNEGEPTTQNNTKQLEIINDGSCILIKDGKLQSHMSKEQLRGLNWLNSAISGAVLTLENVSDENFDNAKLIYKVQREQILDRIEYENGIPVYTANLKLYISLLEANGAKEDVSKTKEPSYISDRVREMIEKQVKSEINSSLNFLIENRADTIDMYERFYQSKRSETKQFLKSISGQPEDFLEKVVFKVIVSIFPV